MNSICLSTDSLPVLGLDVAKKSVQAELRTAGGKTVRFGFENNAKGFAQLACVLKEHNVPKVWAGLEATGPYSHALALWLHGAGHRLSLLNPAASQTVPSQRRQSQQDALVAAGVVKSRPQTTLAKQAGQELVNNYGFKKLPVSNPYEAPVGSVLVYGAKSAAGTSRSARRTVSLAIFAQRYHHVGRSWASLQRVSSGRLLSLG